jgi:hypothetical protein
MVSIRAAIRKQEAVVGEDKLKPKMDIMGDDQIVKTVGESIIVRQPTAEETAALLKAYPGHNLFGRLSGKLRGKPSPTKGVPFHDFNLERIAGSSRDDVRALIDGVVGRIADSLDHKTTRTFAEVQMAADALGLHGGLKFLHEGLDKAKLKDLDVYLVAGGHAHVQLALAVKKSFDKFLRAKAAGAPQDELDHLYSIASGGMQLQGVFVHELINMRTAVGRSLASLRNFAVANEQAAAPLYNLIQRSERLGHKDGPDAQQMIAEAYVLMPDPTQQSTFIKQLASKGRLTVDMIVEVYVNGLLASPTTHMVNVLSNAINGAMTVPERAVGAVAGKARRLVRRGVPEEHIEFGEATSYAYALVSSFGDGFRAMWRSYMTEMPSDLHSKLDMPARSITGANMSRLIPYMDEDGAAARGVDFMAKWFVRQPGRLLIAEDEWFKAIFKRAEMKALAHRRAVELVRSGMDVEDAAREAVEQIMINPSQQVRMRLVEAAQQRTYQQDLEGGVAKLAPFFTSPAMKPISPFYKTPTNIAKALIDRTPLPMLDAVWGRLGLGDGPIGKLGLSDFQKSLKEGGPAADMALGKMAFGSMLLGSVYMLMESLEEGGEVEKEGDLRVTGGWPPDKKSREAWQRAGIQPYSIHRRNANGSWTAASFSRFEPISGLLAMVADYRQLSKWEGAEHLSDIMIAMTSGIYNYVGSMPMMQAVEQLSNAVSYRAEGVDGLEAIVGAFAKVYTSAGLQAAQNAVSLGTMPPTLTNLMQGIADPQFRSYLPPEHNNSLIMRNIWAAFQKWRAGIPGLSQGLQPRLNRWGETVRGVDRPYLPVRIQTKDYSDVDIELVNLDGGVTMPRKKIDQVDLSAEQYNRWLEISADPTKARYARDAGVDPDTPTLLQALRQGIANPYYKEWDKGDKVAHLQNIVTERDKISKGLLLMEYPELRSVIDKDKAERKKGSPGPGLDF